MRSRCSPRGSGDESCSSMKDPEPRDNGGGIIRSVLLDGLTTERERRPFVFHPQDWRGGTSSGQASEKAGKA